MSEAPSKVRLVRCPNCENLLAEITDFFVYQCGGCGSVLRARNKGAESDTFSVKSDEETGGGVSEKTSGEFGNSNLQSGWSGNDELTSTSTRKAGESETGSTVKPRNNLAVEAEHKLKTSQEATQAGIAEPQFESLTGSGPSMRTLNWGSRTTNEMNRFKRNSGSEFLEEEPSSYSIRSTYEYAEIVNDDDFQGMAFRKAELREVDDKAEILRKLDELKDQIAKSRGKVPMTRRVPLQFTQPDHMTRPPYNPTTYAEPIPSTDSKEMATYRDYSSSQASSQVPSIGDPFRPQILRKGPNQAPIPYEQNPSHPYYAGKHMNKDLFDNYRVGNPSYNNRNPNNQQVPPVLPSDFSIDRLSEIPNFPNLFHHESRIGSALRRDFNDSRFLTHPSLGSHNPESHTRWPSDVSSETGSGFVRHRHRRVLLPSGIRRCRPVAGGAPFFKCLNCFELLRFPKKIWGSKKTHYVVRCGSCSEVILFSLTNKRIVLFAQPESEKDFEDGSAEGSPVHDHDDIFLKNGHTSWAGEDFASIDYENSGYEFQAGPEFQSMDKNLVSPPAAPGFGSNRPAAMKSHSTSSSSSSVSEEDNPPGSVLTAIDEGTRSAVPETNANKPPSPPAGSPLQELFDYSSKYNRGQQVKPSGEREIVPQKSMAWQSSMKDTAVATELDISANDYTNDTGTSQESGDANRDDRLKILRGGNIFAGIIKKSLREFSRSAQNAVQGKINVTVNGHPIPDRLVKKVEKLAGHIQPGDYWYDFRAGFWGVMGGPCRGIVPPFIEAFNYPMLDDCAGGNTGVFVNGRQLHQRDLDLLASRGLPSERDRRYIIEISGRVLDEDSGEELDSLGKLAPSVEKAKHGFGMKPPKVSEGKGTAM